VTQGDKLQCRLHRFSTDVVFGTRTRSGLIDGLAREHAERDRDRQRCRERGQGTRDGIGEDIEVGGLASDQAAERHDRIETSRSREHRNRGWQLERARDVELLDLGAFHERRLHSALGERTGDFVVPACPYDRDARSRVGILHPRRSLPRRRHLPQSSPRMPHSLVSG
jgi:hypothetical protein